MGDMTATAKLPGIRFTHRWATRLCRQNPWYRFAANRMIEVQITDTEVISRVMFPFLAWGFPNIRLNLAAIVSVQRGSLWGYPTVQIVYRSADGATQQSLEHAFTTLFPLPLVTGRGEEFMEALEAGRQRARTEP